MLTILEIPKQDPPLAAPPTGIAPEKLAAVKAAAQELEEGMHAGVSPQKLSNLLDSFWSAQKAVAGEKPLLSRSTCPNCGSAAEHIPGMGSDRRRCTKCRCEFSSPMDTPKPCVRCTSPLTVKVGGAIHCNACGADFR